MNGQEYARAMMDSAEDAFVRWMDAHESGDNDAVEQAETDMNAATEAAMTEDIGYYTVIETEGRGCCFCGRRAVNIHANYAECADCGAI